MVDLPWAPVVDVSSALGDQFVSARSACHREWGGQCFPIWRVPIDSGSVGL